MPWDLVGLVIVVGALAVFISLILSEIDNVGPTSGLKQNEASSEPPREAGD